MAKSAQSLQEDRALAAQAARRAEAARRIADGRKVWKAITRVEQFRLVRECFDARAEELRAAHPDIVSVGYGFRESGRGSKRRVGTEPCVVFVVPAKWRGKEPGNTAQRRRSLPAAVLSHMRSKGKSVLVSLPVDVIESADFRLHYAQVTARSASAGRHQTGVVCCLARRDIAGSKIFALGCHHVLALSKILPMTPRDVLAYAPPEAPDDCIGRLSDFCGIMRPDFQYSFDAALIDVTADLSLVEPVVAMRNTTAFYRRDLMPSRYRILTPDRLGAPGRSIPAKFVRVKPDCDEITYAWSPPHRIVQQEVYELQVTNGALPPEVGDSGSPVTGLDGAFAGMHIAGKGDRTLMIPAYELLLERNYGFSSGGKHLKLLNSPFST